MCFKKRGTFFKNSTERRHQRRQRRRSPRGRTLLRACPWHTCHPSSGLTAFTGQMGTRGRVAGLAARGPYVCRASAGEAPHLPPRRHLPGMPPGSESPGPGSKGPKGEGRLPRGLTQVGQGVRATAEAGGGRNPLGQQQCRARRPSPSSREVKSKRETNPSLADFSPGMLLKKEFRRNPWKCFDIWI